MIRIINVKVKNEVIKVSSVDERRNVNRVKNLLFGKMISEMRDKVMMILVSKFSRLRYEDVEEIFSDGCLVLWNKMKSVELKNENLMQYLVKICKNIGMHYLRKVKDDVLSLDDLMERKGDKVEDDGEGLMRMFDIIDEGGCEEKWIYRRLDNVWEKLSDVDRMILECYYWEGCKMDEISRKIGYKNADCVKSKKSKILKKMMDMMKNEEGGKKMPPSYLLNCHLYKSA